MALVAASTRPPTASDLTRKGGFVSPARPISMASLAMGEDATVGPESAKAAFDSLGTLADGLAKWGVEAESAEIVTGGVPKDVQYAAFLLRPNFDGDRFEVKDVIVSDGDAYIRIDKWFGQGESNSVEGRGFLLVIAIPSSTKILSWHSVLYAAE